MEEISHVLLVASLLLFARGRAVRGVDTAGRAVAAGLPRGRTLRHRAARRPGRRHSGFNRGADRQPGAGHHPARRRAAHAVRHPADGRGAGADAGHPRRPHHRVGGRRDRGRAARARLAVRTAARGDRRIDRCRGGVRAARRRRAATQRARRGDARGGVRPERSDGGLPDGRDDRTDPRAGRRFRDDRPDVRAATAGRPRRGMGAGPPARPRGGAHPAGRGAVRAADPVGRPRRVRGGERAWRQRLPGDLPRRHDRRQPAASCDRRRASGQRRLRLARAGRDVPAAGRDHRRRRTPDGRDRQGAGRRAGVDAGRASARRRDLPAALPLSAQGSRLHRLGRHARRGADRARVVPAARRAAAGLGAVPHRVPDHADVAAAAGKHAGRGGATGGRAASAGIGRAVERHPRRR